MNRYHFRELAASAVIIVLLSWAYLAYTGAI